MAPDEGLRRIIPAPRRSHETSFAMVAKEATLEAMTIKAPGVYQQALVKVTD